MAFPTTTILLLLFSVISSLSSAQPPPTTTTLGFRCNTTTTTTTNCYSLIDYKLPNTTTLSSLLSLFQIKNLRTLLASNNLPTTTTPHNTTLPSNSILKIPFPCLCRNGTGVSDRRPTYTVVPDDGLFHIAAEVFSGLVTYPQIQVVNNISDANRIMVGQRLWIPLPCSCDDVGGEKVVHYGHFVKSGSTVEGMANEFNTTEKILLDLNGMKDAKELQANSILDVPLKVCKSMVANNSLDYPLLVPNGTYVYTANNCVRCRCDAMNNWMLECEPSGLTMPQGQTCPSTMCAGTSFNLGNITSGTGCSRSRCVYTGYTNGRINTAISQDSTCPEANNNETPGSGSRDWRPSLVVGASLIAALHLLG